VVSAIYIIILLFILSAYGITVQLDRSTGLMVGIAVWLTGGFICWIFSVTGAEYVEEKPLYSTEDPPS
jgi:hypothetical protein